MKKTNNVLVEISVLKPIGYSLIYLVEGTDDRWGAMKVAAEYMDKQQEGCMKCVNVITANLTSNKSFSKRVTRIANKSNNKTTRPKTSKDSSGKA